MKKHIFVSLLAMASFSKVQAIECINDRPLTLMAFLTSDIVQCLRYPALNDGNGEFGKKRWLGYHNMAVNVPGYKPVHLVKDDECKSPANFTLLAKLMGDTNPIVQRWACFRSPLCFAFKVDNDELYVTSANSALKCFSPFRETRKVKLQRDGSEVTGGKVQVEVNGRAVALDEDQILHAIGIV